MNQRPEYDAKGLGMHRDQADLLCWLVGETRTRERGTSMNAPYMPGEHHELDPDHEAFPGAGSGNTSLSRTAWSATLHCLTGCAIGEVLGMVIGTSLGWGNVSTIALAVALAFAFGYALTMLPLLRSGLAPAAAARLAFASDTVSIAIMEAVDNYIMLAIPGAMDAPLDSLLFWASLAVALAVAAVVAYPVNRYLIARGRGHAVVHAFHGERCH